MCIQANLGLPSIWSRDQQQWCSGLWKRTETFHGTCAEEGIQRNESGDIDRDPGSEFWQISLAEHCQPGQKPKSLSVYLKN